MLAGCLLVSLTVFDTAKGVGLTVAALMILVARLACAVSALRALRIQPAALREGA